MAHADTLPDNHLDTIAEEISKFIGAIRETLENAIPNEMGETFSLWMLEADKIKPSTSDLSQLASSINRWHHQLRAGNNAIMFGRSVQLQAESSSWSIQEVVESQIASKIDRAIDWIDNNTENDPLVRILVVPAYQVYAFWLLEGDNSHVLMVDFPPNFTKLATARLYSSQEFLDALSQEKIVMGI